MMKHVIFTSLVLLCATFLCAQIVINEASSSNQNTILDGFGDSPDWIELYNTSDELVNLQGWHLSDNENQLSKWQMSDVNIGAKEYLLIFASGNDLLLNYPHTNFKLSKEGEVLTLSNPDLEIIDQIVLPALETDFSFGRKIDGAVEWGYFKNPSPKSSNQSGVWIEQTPKPQFSLLKNFHPQSVFLELICESPNCEIRYTKDGSVPTQHSFLFESAFQIDTTTTIRAKAFLTDQIPSNVSTQTYFIGENHALPVLAITSEPEHFFDFENGIFETGPDASPDWPFWGANYWKDIEIPVHFEYFDVNGALQVEFDCGAKTHGGRGARTWPQKPMRFLAERQFGVDKMEYPFFEYKNVDSFERLVIRNSSGDFNRSHFRSGFLSRKAILDGLDIDALAYQPVVLYINGSYWGVINLREKGDEFYVESNYGIPVENLDVLEESDLVIVGDFGVFDQHYDFVMHEDLSVESNFQIASTYFDINSLVDYFAFQSIITNTDWPQNNIKFWRERSPEGKWRYILFDLDTSTGNNTWNQSDFNVFRGKMEQFDGANKHINILQAFLSKEGFKKYFLNRYADLLNTSFRPEIFSAELLEIKEILLPEMPRHFERWDFCTLCRSFEEWEDRHIPNFIEFAETRAPHARQHLIDYFELENEVHLELQTYPPNAGAIEINSIYPEQLPWDGWYFNGIPVTLTIHPKPGFVFSHWLSLETIKEPNPNQSIELNFSSDDAITAYFKNIHEPAKLQVTPNPAKEIIQAHFEIDVIQEVKISLFDVNGQIIFENWKTYNAGVHEIEIFLRDAPSGVYFLQVAKSEEVAVGKVMLF